MQIYVKGVNQSNCIADPAHSAQSHCSHCPHCLLNPGWARCELRGWKKT